MNKRFLLAFVGFLFVVGIGTFWLLINISKRKRLLKNLLSLPSDRRFFWYKLRKDGFDIIDYNKSGDFNLSIDDSDRQYSLKIDFLACKKNNKYACLFSTTTDEAELLKIFFVYQTVFKVDGVIFYDEFTRSFNVWERA